MKFENILTNPKDSDVYRNVNNTGMYDPDGVALSGKRIVL